MNVVELSTTAARPRSSQQPDVMTEDALCDSVAQAAPGSVITYHVGQLARDRDHLASSLAPEQRQALNAVAGRAWKLAAAGWAHLVQRRVGEACFAYQLVISRRPLSARSTRAMRPLARLLTEAA